MKTELTPMRKDWMEMKNMIIQLKHRMETMEGGGNTEKMKSAHYRTLLRTSSHLKRKWRRGFFRINEMFNQSTIKLDMPNNMATRDVNICKLVFVGVSLENSNVPLWRSDLSPTWKVNEGLLTWIIWHNKPKRGEERHLLVCLLMLGSL